MYRPKLTVKTTNIFIPKRGRQNVLLFLGNANNLSIQVKLVPEIPCYLNLKAVLFKWHNVCANINTNTADCSQCKMLFSPCKWERDYNSPIDKCI